VVDAEDLPLTEDVVHDPLEAPRGGEVVPERLLDDHPHVALLGAMQAGLLERRRDDGEEGRRRREVVRPVERHRALGVELGQGLAEPAVRRGVTEVEADVARALEQPVEHELVGRAARERADGLARQRPELVVGLLRARDPDEVEALGQRPLVGEVVERRQQLAAREVPRGPEDDERGGRYREALETLDERVLGGGDGRHQPPARSIACPPNCWRSAASRRCV
jgi:hypothetical protein